MGLKDGSLQRLITKGRLISISSLCESMLKALDYITTQGIIHFAVKPENILYRRGGETPYHFLLGDFDFSHCAESGGTVPETSMYSAPELFGERNATHKLDVWSLYVTIIWTLNPEGFRERFTECQTIGARVAVLSTVSQLDGVSNLCEMARVNPTERASAAQMLVKCFGGNGLSTPLTEIPPLVPTLTEASSRPPQPDPEEMDIVMEG